MPNTREKLIEKIDPILKSLPWGEITSHTEEDIADRLIEEGVTIAKDNNVPSKWISVKDRLPEDASTVLAIDSDGTISSAYYVGRWHSGGDLDEDAVTHWMTLPTAPKEDEQ